jgi:hypothetical protein
MFKVYYLLTLLISLNALAGAGVEDVTNRTCIPQLGRNSFLDDESKGYDIMSKQAKKDGPWSYQFSCYDKVTKTISEKTYTEGEKKEGEDELKYLGFRYNVELKGKSYLIQVPAMDRAGKRSTHDQLKLINKSSMLGKKLLSQKEEAEIIKLLFQYADQDYDLEANKEFQECISEKNSDLLPCYEFDVSIIKETEPSQECLDRFIKELDESYSCELQKVAVKNPGLVPSVRRASHLVSKDQKLMALNLPKDKCDQFIKYRKNDFEKNPIKKIGEKKEIPYMCKKETKCEKSSSREESLKNQRGCIMNVSCDGETDATVKGLFVVSCKLNGKNSCKDISADECMENPFGMDFQDQNQSQEKENKNSSPSVNVEN